MSGNHQQQLEALCRRAVAINWTRRHEWRYRRQIRRDLDILRGMKYEALAVKGTL